MGVWDIVETAPIEFSPIGVLKSLKAPSEATATPNDLTLLRKARHPSSAQSIASMGTVALHILRCDSLYHIV